MNWEDEGVLLSKRKFRENANIINVLTNKYGKVSGIVYGGNSRKIRNYLQIGNKIYVSYNSKSENRIGYFKTELVEPVAPKYFNDKKRTSSLLSFTSILNVLLPEAQAYKNIYDSINNLMQNFDNNNWIIYYSYWELDLIKELGFGVNFEKSVCAEKENDLVKILIDNSEYLVPKFITLSKIPKDISNLLIKRCLTFNRVLMMNKFFLPNNLIFPKSRIILENYFN